MGEVIGYARVSTTGQSLETQLDLLNKSGANQVFSEKASGKSTEKRPELDKALTYLRKGDILIVTKLDRLARSVLDLHTIAKKLEEKGVDLRVLDQPELDTTSKTGKLLFSLLGAVGEFERALILERTQEGRDLAKAKGVRFGRKPSVAPDQASKMRAQAAHWQGSKADLAKSFGVSRATLYRVLSGPA
jgi:DNA invertase Pin-like site-specific DNA recombinase